MNAMGPLYVSNGESVRVTITTDGKLLTLRGRHFEETIPVDRCECRVTGTKMTYTWDDRTALLDFGTEPYEPEVESAGVESPNSEIQQHKRQAKIDKRGFARVCKQAKAEAASYSWDKSVSEWLFLGLNSVVLAALAIGVFIVVVGIVALLVAGGLELFGAVSVSL